MGYESKTWMDWREIVLAAIKKKQGLGKLEHEDCPTFWFFLNTGLTDVELQQGPEPFRVAACAVSCLVPLSTSSCGLHCLDSFV